MIAYCWASGQIEFGRRVPTGAIEIARGGEQKLRKAISVTSRHGYAKGVLLVPGVPEAEDETQALRALSKHLAWLAAGNRGIRVNYPTDDLTLQAERRGR